MVSCEMLNELANNMSEISPDNVTHVHYWIGRVYPSAIPLTNRTLHDIPADLLRRIQECVEKPEYETASFITSNERMLVAIILGVALIFLILMTLKFSLKVFSRYYEDRNEDIDIDTSLQL